MAGDCWTLIDFVIPGLAMFGALLVTIVSLGVLVENRRLLRMQPHRASIESTSPSNGEPECERMDIPSS